MLNNGLIEKVLLLRSNAPKIFLNVNSLMMVLIKVKRVSQELLLDLLILVLDLKCQEKPGVHKNSNGMVILLEKVVMMLASDTYLAMK